jgi:hypothetical protein
MELMELEAKTEKLKMGHTLGKLSSKHCKVTNAKELPVM